MREFNSWATRDTATGKLEYANYIHPLNDFSFANYMRGKQIIDGEYRRGDNWQKGIPPESLFDSLCRHIEILKLLYKWHRVYETKTNWVVELVVDWDVPHTDWYESKTIENELNAIRFNSEALKLSFLLHKDTNE